jgi:hypothetical protein
MRQPPESRLRPLAYARPNLGPRGSHCHRSPSSSQSHDRGGRVAVAGGGPYAAAGGPGAYQPGLRRGAEWGWAAARQRQRGWGNGLTKICRLSQIPGPVSRIAPKPSRTTGSSPPMRNVPLCCAGRLVVMVLIDGLLTSVSRRAPANSFECQVRPVDASPPCQNKVRLPSRDQRFCPGHVAAEWAHFHQEAAALAAPSAASRKGRIPTSLE